VTVEGFTVKGAEGEGILAINPHPRSVKIEGMPLFTGKPLTTSPSRTTSSRTTTSDSTTVVALRLLYAQRRVRLWEGIHLLSVARSSVVDNQSVGNSGGILLTDEFGPNHDNLVEGKLRRGQHQGLRHSPCRATISGSTQDDQPDPSFGRRLRQPDHRQSGDSHVWRVWSRIGVFAPGSFTASYNNVVSGNLIEGNGLAGISVHSHQAMPT